MLVYFTEKHLHSEQEREAWTADQSSRIKTLLIEPFLPLRLQPSLMGCASFLSLSLSAVTELEFLPRIFYTRVTSVVVATTGGWSSQLLYLFM